MPNRPKVRYAKNDGVSIAYTRYGSGEHMVVVTPPWVSNVDLCWDLEEYVRLFEHASSYYEFILIDKRGVGLSDRTDSPPTLEQRVSDTLAVMDAEGVESAAIVGFSEAAAIGIALAARHPERVDRLVLQGSALPDLPTAELQKFTHRDDVAYDPKRLHAVVDLWGSDDCSVLDIFSPSAAGNPRVEAWSRRFEVNSASPGAVRSHLKAAMAGRILADLDDVSCPVFIGHAKGDLVVPISCSRYLASRFPDATVIYWDSPDHLTHMSPDWREMQNDMIEFITGSRPAPITTTRFAVVLFTDIVNSTAQARAVGDESWGRLIRAHDATADRVIESHGGCRIKSTGDGLLATFHDPGNALISAVGLREELAVLGIEIRAGLHAGLVEELPDGDIIGIAVNTAARIQDTATAGQICVSRTVTELLEGSAFEFKSLGTRPLKGLASPIEIFVATSVRSA